MNKLIEDEINKIKNLKIDSENLMAKSPVLKPKEFYMTPKLEKIPERIRSKFKIGKACWKWIAATTGKGYGCVFWRGKGRRAHRVIYEILVGKIPAKKFVCHTCNNRSCVNPKHLYIGDNSTNQRDRVRSGNHWATNRTHCPKGHEYTASNTKRNKTGRVCIECDRAMGRTWWRKTYGKNIRYRSA